MKSAELFNQTAIPSGITNADVLSAIADLDRGIDHPFGPSTKYDLVYQEHRYPPKAVLGLAARRVHSKPLSPADFGAGQDSKCFKVLTELGFVIEPKPITVLPAEPEGAVWIEFANNPDHGGTGWELTKRIGQGRYSKDGPRLQGGIVVGTLCAVCRPAVES